MIGIFSDVHGNYYALERVIDELKRRNCRRLYCLGDVGGYYSMINECIELLRRENVICLKGNHDSYLLGESVCPRSRSANDCIAYQRRVITRENLKWLECLSPSVSTDSFQAVHGGWNDPLDEYIENFNFEAAALRGEGCKLYFSGHTHVQKLESHSGIVYCNPGSVGQPRDYDWRAAYALLDEEGQVTLHRVEYAVDQTARAMDKAGFDSYYYRNLYRGCKIGENYD